MGISYVILNSQTVYFLPYLKLILLLAVLKYCVISLCYCFVFCVYVSQHIWYQLSVFHDHPYLPIQ